MKIGITFDLKGDLPPTAGAPDDFQEEFDSPATIEGIAGALGRLGHEAVWLGDGPGLLRRLLDEPPGLVFNIAEGQGTSRSREARVPAVLEMLGIPYTGSDPLTLAVTLDKDSARRLLRSHGGIVPRGEVFTPDRLGDADLAAVRARASLPYTMIVKPAWEGSSKGIRGKCVVDKPADLADALAARRDQRQPLLAEEFIAGEELTVGVVGNDPPRVVGVLRVVPLGRPERFVYSLEVKRDYQRHVRYECPPRLPEEWLRAVEKSALHAYRALGCRDVARLDFRLREGVPYFLEVNPLPGLNPETSDLVILARMSGMGYDELISAILDSALTRHGLAG
jgi:D-alanine-D-alanine ligase